MTTLSLLFVGLMRVDVSRLAKAQVVVEASMMVYTSCVHSA